MEKNRTHLLNEWKRRKEAEKMDMEHMSKKLQVIIFPRESEKLIKKDKLESESLPPLVACLGSKVMEKCKRRLHAHVSP